MLNLITLFQYHDAEQQKRALVLGYSIKLT